MTTNSFVDEQKELLSKCVVRFKFEKKDGTIREAIGTTNLKFIPDAKHPKNVQTTNDNQIPYYDLETGVWKSMQINARFMHLKSWKSVPLQYKNNAR